MIKKTKILENGSVLHSFSEPEIDFHAFICLDLRHHGRALGGARFLPYSSLAAAEEDAIRLSQAMSYKAFISGVSFDGGKATFVAPQKPEDRPLFLSKFAECVESLKGAYITTIDSGTTPADMSFLRTETSYAVGDLASEALYGSTAEATAFGVYQGIRAAVKVQYDQEDLTSIRIAIQGLGNVGRHLVSYLVKQNARIMACDLNAINNAPLLEIVTPSEIYAQPCDIFSPCALGKVLNLDTISRLRACIIAGAANDQLETLEMDNVLAKKGILYIPDFVLNAGGLIHLALQFKNPSVESIQKEVSQIYHRIEGLCLAAKADDKTPLDIALSFIKENQSAPSAHLSF